MCDPEVGVLRRSLGWSGVALGGGSHSPGSGEERLRLFCRSLLRPSAPCWTFSRRCCSVSLSSTWTKLSFTLLGNSHVCFQEPNFLFTQRKVCPPNQKGLDRRLFSGPIQALVPQKPNQEFSDKNRQSECLFEHRGSCCFSKTLKFTFLSLKMLLKPVWLWIFTIKACAQFSRCSPALRASSVCRSSMTCARRAAVTQQRETF